MACLKEELRTKDKKQIDIIYKKLQRYAARLGQETPDIKGTTKECKVEFINELTTNSNVLYAVLSDITISEYGCIEKKSRNPQYNMYLLLIQFMLTDREDIWKVYLPMQGSF